MSRRCCHRVSLAGLSSPVCVCAVVSVVVVVVCEKEWNGRTSVWAYVCVWVGVGGGMVSQPRCCDLVWKGGDGGVDVSLFAPDQTQPVLLVCPGSLHSLQFQVTDIADLVLSRFYPGFREGGGAAGTIAVQELRGSRDEDTPVDVYGDPPPPPPTCLLHPNLESNTPRHAPTAANSAGFTHLPTSTLTTCVRRWRMWKSVLAVRD